MRTKQYLKNKNKITNEQNKKDPNKISQETRYMSKILKLFAICDTTFCCRMYSLCQRMQLLDPESKFELVIS